MNEQQSTESNQEIQGVGAFQALPLEILNMIVMFLQGKSGPATKNVLAFASTCKSHRNIASIMKEIRQPTRTVYAVITDFHHGNDYFKIYKKREIMHTPESLSFESILNIWRETSKNSEAALSKERIFRWIKDKEKPPFTYLIFELLVTRSMIEKLHQDQMCEVDPSKVDASNIKRVTLLKSACLPLFLSMACDGAPIRVTPDCLDEPTLLDNTHFSAPHSQLCQI